MNKKENIIVHGSPFNVHRSSDTGIVTLQGVEFIERLLPMDETLIFWEVLERGGVLSEYRPINIFNVYQDAVSPGFMY